MMSENQREIEAHGSDVEAAIKTGLARLGLNRSDVIVEIVDEGSRGLLGIGSREAVVRLTPMLPPTPIVAPAETRESDQAMPEAISYATPAAETTDEDEDASLVVIADQEYNEREPEVAIEVIQALLEKMQVKATISAHLSEPDDVTGRQVNFIEILGPDLGVLIGPRGETLNALQYISRLMVGHQLRRRADFIIDVEKYRQRREQALAVLAERMAQKVIKRRQPVSLEPMPPHERRIIHITLRNYENVYTQSVGEGKRRKVRIIPK
jgi:spoIIIJ-associated protein